MAVDTLTLTVGGNSYDLKVYNPAASWRLKKEISYFKFPGSSEKIMLDLLENQELISLELRAVASDVTAVIRPMMIDIRENGTDPTTNLTTLLWGDLGTFTVSVTDFELNQKAGEGQFYTLSIKFFMSDGPV